MSLASKGTRVGGRERAYFCQPVLPTRLRRGRPRASYSLGLSFPNCKTPSTLSVACCWGGNVWG